MSQTIDVNGQSINYPETGDTNWGDEATDFAVQTSAALGKLGLASGTTVDIPSTLDVTGNTTLDANLSVGGDASITGNTTLTGNITVNGNSSLGNGTSDTTAITGILNVDSGVLYVDPVNNRVGINKTNPAQALDVVGNSAISGNETVGGTLGVTGNVSVNTNKFNVTASSGNTSIAGTLGVTGIESITNTTDASSSTNGALIVSGGVGIAKKLYVGTDLSVGGSLTVTGGINPPYWNIVDQKASGTDGGTFTSGAWRTRDLNTTRGTNSITGSSLSSNQIILPSGTYRIFARCPALQSNNHKTKLRNISDSTDTLIGSSSYANNTTTVSNDSIINGVFTIASQKTFEIQHICTNTTSGNGFGAANSSFAVSEIYTTVELWKLI